MALRVALKRTEAADINAGNDMMQVQAQSAGSATKRQLVFEQL